MYALTPEAVVISFMILIEGIFIVFVLREKKEHGAVGLALFLLVISLHNVAYMLETMAQTYEMKRFYDSLQYIVLAWYPLVLLHFSNRYFSLRLHNVSVFYLLFFSISLVLSIIILSSPLHELFLTDLQFPEGVFRPNVYTPRLFVYVLNIYGLFGGLLYCYYSFFMSVSEKGIFRERGMLMLMMVLVPLVGLFFYVAMKDSITFYYSPFLYFLGTAFPKYLMIRGRLFGSVPVELSRLKESLIDGVIIIDRSGIILDMNRKMSEFFPEITEASVGLHVEKVSETSPFLQKIHARETADTLQAGTVIEHGRPDGSLAAYEVRRSYSTDFYHRSSASIFTIRDVSDVRTMQKELVHRHEKIREDNRLKGLLIDVISHDVRSPLILMKGLRQLMASGVVQQNPALWTRGGEDLDALIDRADSLIANLLALSESFNDWESYPLRPVALSDLMPQLHDAVRRLRSRKQVDFVCQVEDAPAVTAHPSLLKAVLQNVFENAVKYSPPGHTVHVDARASAGVLQLSVENRGEPIDPKALEAFQNGMWGVTCMGSAGEKGPGIGVYASARFMKKMGGSLQIIALDDGTRAVLTLSVSDEERVFDGGGE